MDYRDFSTKIKSKYPQYQDMDDMELAQKMVQKFPQYKDVTFVETKTTEESPTGKSLYDAMYPRLTKIQETGKGNPLVAGALDIGSMPGRAAATIVGKGAESLANFIFAPKKKQEDKIKLSSEQLRNLETTGRTSLDQQQKTQMQKQYEPAKGILEEFAKTGAEGTKGVESLAQSIVRDPATLIPGVGGVGKAASLGKLALKGTGVGLGSAAIHQGENVAQGDEINYLAGGLETILGGTLPVAGQVASKSARGIGKGIMSANIRPGQTGRKQGFKIDNLFKRKLDKNTLEAMENESIRYLDDYKIKLKNFEKTNGSIPVDIGKAYSETLNKLSGGIENIGENKAIFGALDNLTDELSILKSSVVDFSDAQSVKRAAQKQGAWVQGALKKQWDENLSAKEKVYNTFSSEIKKQINNSLEKANPALKNKYAEINKAFEEVIPIESAITRRRIISESNYPIKPFETFVGVSTGAGLGAASDIARGENPIDNLWKNMLYGAIGGAGPYVGRKVVGSPATARALYKVGTTKSPTIATDLAKKYAFNPNADLYEMIFGTKEQK